MRFTVSVDHTPRPHPMSPTGKLPSSFSSHTPSFASVSTSSKPALKYTPPGPGEYGSISELPLRFRYKNIDETEIGNINGGGSEVIFH